MIKCAIIKSKMNDNETYEFESRRYVDPALSSSEQEQFISNLRDTQNQNNSEIVEQTYNLGTDVPSNLGGLGGGEAYFSSRYQTPQVDEMVSTLKSAAQAQALNDVMTNYQNQLQNQYKQAYRKYQSRERARARSSSSGGSGSKSGGKSGGNSSGWNGDIGTKETGSGDDPYGLYKNMKLGDDYATYGLGMLRREEGETDAEWFRRANEWLVKQAAMRNHLRTGKM